MTTVLLQVSHGKRPNVDMIPEQRPQECNQMISVMKQCWDQEDRKRPPFSGIEKAHLMFTVNSLSRICGGFKL